MVRETTQAGSRRRNRGLTALLSAAALIAATLPAAAAGDAVLSQFAGSWIGRGKYWASPDAKPELVYCKVTNTLTADGAGLQQTGRCAVATNSGPIKGLISSTGDGAYEGSLESISTAGAAKLEGKGAVDRIDFHADFIDRKSRKPGKAVITLIAGDGKYRLVSNPLDASGHPLFVTSDILFTHE